MKPIVRCSALRLLPVSINFLEEVLESFVVGLHISQAPFHPLQRLGLVVRLISVGAFLLCLQLDFSMPAEGIIDASGDLGCGVDDRFRVSTLAKELDQLARRATTAGLVVLLRITVSAKNVLVCECRLRLGREAPQKHPWEPSSSDSPA